MKLSEYKAVAVKTVKKILMQAVAKMRISAVLLLPLAVCLSGCASKSVLEDSMLPKEQPREEIQQILDHYPAGDIGSVAQADEILEIVDQEKKNIDARLYNEKLICNDKYFVYWCYEEAEAQKRTDSRALTMLEIEAKRYKRANDVRQSDLQRDIDEMDAIADAPDRFENIKSHNEKLKRVQEKEKKRELAARGITDDPKKRHQGNLMTPQEKERNVKAYEQKQKDKEKRLKEVEENRAKTEKRRQDAEKRKEKEAKKKEELRKAREKAAARRSSF